ncbi:MOSC domain-containing protein [Anderseniella sp. Alg231-50]|uniref:MOSC domain-containing protein n=1 Tax=Anderseniella sp. Alg231-50 TaxID=1922226 RepID=UPI000D551C1E
MASMITICALNTYPVKGMTVQTHESIQVSAGETFPFDRSWAIEAGARKFDVAAPAYLPKIAFTQLMSHEKIAGLETNMDVSGGNPVFTINRGGKQVARGDLSTPVGRQIIEQFMAAYMKDELRGSPRVVHADGHHFTDVPAKFISILNLASVREIERVVGKPLDPLRFRANIHIDGAQPWEEFSWLGKTLQIDGAPVFRVAERIQRCAATSVNPQTAERDMNLPRTLMSAFQHDDCGIYVSASADHVLETGHEVTVE